MLVGLYKSNNIPGFMDIVDYRQYLSSCGEFDQLIQIGSKGSL